MSAPYWIDIFDAIVTNVQDDADNALAADEPFYMHGHPLEIINTLSRADSFLLNISDETVEVKFLKFSKIAAKIAVLLSKCL